MLLEYNQVYHRVRVKFYMTTRKNHYDNFVFGFNLNVCILYFLYNCVIMNYKIGKGIYKKESSVRTVSFIVWFSIHECLTGTLSSST